MTPLFMLRELGDQTWRADALCTKAVDLGLAEPDYWFPGRGEAEEPSARLARDICRACPVADDCLAMALAVPRREDVGIWGGLSERRRRAMRTSHREDNTDALSVARRGAA